MTKSDWLSLGIRLFGVWLLIRAIDDIRTLIDIYLQYFTPVTTPLRSYFVIAGVHLAFGAFLFVFAENITKIVHGEPRTPASSSPDRPPQA